MLHPVIYSAPFGNYLGDTRHVTRTLGTFTLRRRDEVRLGPLQLPGAIKRLWRVLKTVRYSITLRAFVNRLGLPNPGIDWLLSRENLAQRVAGAIISVHGFNTDEWDALFVRLMQKELSRLREVPLLELNVSCPNVRDDPTRWPAVFESAQRVTGLTPVVKLPPIRWERLAAMAVDAGIQHFHACNTLPVDQGGMSGKPLKRMSLSVVEALRNRYPAATIIGGGGITSDADVQEYRDAGADCFAVGSALLWPHNWWRIAALARRLNNPDAMLATLAAGFAEDRNVIAVVANQASPTPPQVVTAVTVILRGSGSDDDMERWRYRLGERVGPFGPWLLEDLIAEPDWHPEQMRTALPDQFRDSFRVLVNKKES